MHANLIETYWIIIHKKYHDLIYLCFFYFCLVLYRFKKKKSKIKNNCTNKTKKLKSIMPLAGLSDPFLKIQIKHDCGFVSIF